MIEKKGWSSSLRIKFVWNESGGRVLRRCSGRLSEGLGKNDTVRCSSLSIFPVERIYLSVSQHLRNRCMCSFCKTSVFSSYYFRSYYTSILVKNFSGNANIMFRSKTETKPIESCKCRAISDFFWFQWLKVRIREIAERGNTFFS